MSDLAFLDRYREAKARLWGAAIAKNPPAKVIIKRVPKHVPRDWLLVASSYFSNPEKMSTPIGKAAAIVLDVCSKHGLEDYEVLSRRRQPHLVVARNEIYARLVSETNWTVMRISEFVGRNHSAIVKSLRRNNPHLMRRAG